MSENNTEYIQEYFSWIPNNTSQLKFDRNLSQSHLRDIFNDKNLSIDIDNNIHIKNLKIDDYTNYNPSYLFKTSFNSQIIFNETNNSDILTIELFNNKPFIRNLLEILCLVNSDNLYFKVNFEIKKNGELKLYNFTCSNNISDNKYYFNEANYILLKRIFHLDNHHHQKIDTFIGLYTEFDKNQIFKQMQ
jgi:hypothetical protein